MMTEAPIEQLAEIQRNYRRVTRSLKSQPRNRDALLIAIRLTGQLAELHLAVDQPKKAEVYRIEMANLLQRMRELGESGEILWAEGVLNYHRQSWEQAEYAFLKAEPLVGKRSDYWFDRGRTEFARGRLSLALDAFQRAYELEEKGGRIAWRTFRWLATTYRWLGQSKQEADTLHEAMEYMWQRAPERDGHGIGVDYVKILNIDDSGKEGTLETATHSMAMARLPRLLIDEGKYDEAIDLIEEWYSNTHQFQAEFSAMKVEALFRKGNAKRANEYAEHMAGRFKGGHMRYHSDPKTGRRITVDWEASKLRPPSGSVPVSGGDLVIASALIHSNQPFSGNQRLLEALKDAVPPSLNFSVSIGHRQLPVKASPTFIRVYHAARRAIETGRIDLATDLLWEVASIALKERSPTPLAYAIHELNRVAGDHPKLEQLCQEAQQRYAESSEIMLEVGRYFKAQSQYAQALSVLEIAARKPREAIYAEPLIAELIGQMGDQEEALRRFKSLLERDWSKESLTTVSEAIFMPAIRWAETSGQPFWVLSWVDVWLAQYDRLGNYEGAVGLYEAAGRVALLLKEYERAYTFYLHAAAAYVARFNSSAAKGVGVNLHDVARNNAMTALSGILAGRVEEASVWLETARMQAAGLDVIDLVSALASARSSNLASARETLLEAERSPLWAQVARLIAQDCRAAGQDNWAEDLERKASVQEGNAPSLEEALDQLTSQERRLLAARQEVEASIRYREQTQEVLETLVVRGGLLPEDHASYLALKEAFETGEPFDPEIILGSVLEHLTEKVQEQEIRGDACERLLGLAWNDLETGLREQLELAQDYIAYAEKRGLKDYGPALMYLAKAIEDLLRTDVARLLVQRAYEQKTGVPWDHKFTLGCVPQRLFGLLPEGSVSLAYRRIVDDVLKTLDPAVRRYIRLDWRADAQALVDARNSWAHRRDALGEDAFKRLLPRIVGAPGSDTILGTALSVSLTLGALRPDKSHESRR